MAKCHPSRAYYINNRCRACDQRWRNTGATPEWIEARTSFQGGLCAICGTGVRLVVDHNHSTKKPRAMLCNQCNTAIGLFYENPALMESAIRYLHAHNPPLS